MVSRTGIGIGIGIPFRNNALGGDKPYLPPEIKDSLRAVCVCYGKTNNDSDRAIVKNLVDPDNPFIISNAAYKLNSGYGEYQVDFTTFGASHPPTTYVRKSDSLNIAYVGKPVAGGECILETINRLNTRLSLSFVIEISGLEDDMEGWFNTLEWTNRIRLTNGINKIDISIRAGDWYGFNFVREDRTALGNCNIVVKQIPKFQGAFVTDGVNDIIVSTKTVDEMEITDEVTVVSMIHQIDGNVNYTNGYTNYIRHGGGFIRNVVTGENGKGFNKTGIYGYTSTNLNSSSLNLGNIVNNILGDKDDYSFERSSTYTLDDAKYSVQNFVNANNQPSNEGSSVAWYWTIIANKVLTTDQINQVIAYFNLDRTLKPDILCNTIKQGITNENHAEFGDKLIDFSGNGRDIQLNNIAWKLDSGIGKYETDLSDTRIWIRSKEIISSPFSFSYNGLSGWILFANTELSNSTDMPSFKIQIKGLLEGQELIYRYYDSNGQSNVYSMGKDGEYTLSSDVRTAKPQTSNTSGFQVVKNEANIITITQIPSHAGALCLDGVNDFGQFVGDLGLKDYTFIMDREYLSLKADQVPVISSINPLTDTPFIFEHCVYEDRLVRPFSFGKDIIFEEQLVSKRLISYQSTYKYKGKDISKGTFVNTGSGLTIGRYGDDRQYANFAFYFLMLFPYSMSEFLIERQLKKHKLGTLYPNMVEFRPIIKHDDRIKNVKYYKLNEASNYINLNIGDYIPVGQRVAIVVDLEEPYKITSIISSSLTDVIIRKAGGVNYAYDILAYVTNKSPQKVTMDIQVDISIVQWNPVITSTVELTTAPTFVIKGTTTLLKPGDWISKSSEIQVVVTMNNLADELRKFSLNGTFIHIPSSSYNPDTGKYEFSFVTDNESTQNINLTIDEYIRYEDIVQPYPVLLRFNDENGNEVSWGGKFRVGSTITRIGSIADPENNLLNGLYSVSGLSLNGKAVTSNTSIVEKQMVFKTTATYLLDNNEPKVILSPRLLRIPNSSYKLLGYIPDISGHGNHGVIHNSAYAEGSGVNKDGSYQFDGVDDFVTIPTTGGGKQVFMKINNNDTRLGRMLYDQRSPSSGGLYSDFAIYTVLDDDTNNTNIAYQARLVGILILMEY